MFSLQNILLTALTGLFLYILPFSVNGQEHSIPTYRNPVIAGDFADPSVVRVGNTYFATGTSSEWAPHYPVYTSNDLVNWQQIGHVFDKMPAWTVGSFWAPELFYHEGTYFVYYTVRRKSDSVSVIGVATSTDPYQGFTDRGMIVEWGREAIDGYVFKDEDGRMYFSWKAYGLDKDKPITLMASEMTSDGLGLHGEPFELIHAENGGMEGQAMIKRGKYYYLFFSTQACCGRSCNYQLEVARATGVKGPWTVFGKNPILKGGGEWQCPGHGTPVNTPDGRYFYMYHAYHDQDFVYTGRQGLIDELLWSEDGWPYFKYGTVPTAQAPTPFQTETRYTPEDFYEEFDQPDISPQWQWDFRNAPEFLSKEGNLQLSVSTTASGSVAGAFLGVRPGQGDYVVTTAIASEGEMLKGLAAYGDANNVLGCGIAGHQLIVWKVENKDRNQLSSLTIPSAAKVFLKMEVKDGYLYKFYWSTDQEKWNYVGDKGEGPEGINGYFLPPWDRAVRAGLSVQGKAGEKGYFGFFKISYE